MLMPIAGILFLQHCTYNIIDLSGVIFDQLKRMRLAAFSFCHIALPTLIIIFFSHVSFSRPPSLFSEFCNAKNFLVFNVVVCREVSESLTPKPLHKIIQNHNKSIFCSQGPWFGSGMSDKPRLRFRSNFSLTFGVKVICIN